MRLPLAAALAASLLVLPAASAAECSGDPGFELLIAPAQVPIGTAFQVTITAPQGSFAILLLSPTAGPTPTPFGPLCVGFPLGGAVAIPIFAPVISFPHFIDCNPAFIGIEGHFQYLAVNPANPGVVARSNSQSLLVIDGACSAVPDPGDYVTFTQGGWGQECNGGNVGCLRDQNFAAVLPNGLVLGDPDGVDADAIWALVLSSSKAVENFLPAGSTAAILSADHTDPLATEAGVFAGQLTAASLNVAFDNAGVFDPMKTNPGSKLADLVFIANVHPLLVGKTVAEVVLLSNQVLSGEVAVPVGLTVSDLSEALDALNNDFDGGSMSMGSLAVPHTP